MRYRDSQGRERWEDALFGAGTSTIFISDPVARMNYTLDQKAHTAQKTGPLPPLPPPAPTHGGSVGVAYLPPSNQAELLKARGLDHGAFVEQVTKGSPGERAGLRRGDVILAVDGQSVRDSDDLGPHIWTVPPGSLVTLNLDRAGQNIDVKVAIQDRTQVFPSIGSGPQTIVSAFSPFPSSEQAQTTTEDLGSKTIEGVLAEGKRSTMTIPAKQVGNKQPIVVVSESWYSSDLQIMILIKHSDPRVGDTVYRLTSISRTEPSPSLFQVPPDYTVTQGPELPGLLPAK
jgi:membrane-associated protease RseP (regulator of RpoE activity)